MLEPTKDRKRLEAGFNARAAPMGSLLLQPVNAGWPR
jgi:hypothetical protein